LTVASALDGDRVPRPQPFNPEAEQRLLGAILIDNQVYHRVAQLLHTDDFGNALHSRVFAAVGKLISEGQEANPILLKNLFDHDEALKSNGGGTYLAHLAGWAAMVTNPEDYATAIRELAARRQIIEACELARDDAYRVDPARPAGRIIQEHTARLAHANSVTTLAELPQCTKLRDWLQRDLAAPDFLLGNVLSTTSRMMLIGRTGLGKTNFAMALAMAIAEGDPFLHWKAARDRGGSFSSTAKCPIANLKSALRMRLAAPAGSLTNFIRCAATISRKWNRSIARQVSALWTA
jgi:replicative DNA helicase